MKSSFAVFSLGLAGLLGSSSTSSADVFVRAPFVRVHVGPGVNVRAPFVNVSTPPRVVYVPESPPPVQVVPVPQNGPVQVLPVPQPIQPAPIKAMTLHEFVNCTKFQCGNYEAVLIHPCTCQPCLVRFCLPDCPRRVTVHNDEIVFHYGLLKKVRVCVR